MDLLKAQAQRIAQQLAGLTASQRMLTGALVVIMAMTLLYWGRYASEGQRVPLLDQTFSDADLARIPMALRAQGIDATPQDDRIVVPSDQRFAALAVLGYEDLLPRDTTSGFDKLAASLINPWDPQKVTDEKLRNISDSVLSQIIRKMPNVRNAQVLTAGAAPRQIGRDARTSASVFVETKDGRADKKLARNIASFVAGSRPAMALGDVTIIVDKLSHRFTDEGAEDQLAGGDLLESIQQFERHNQQKVIELISPYLPNAKVQLSVDLDTRSTQEQSTVYDPKNTITKEVETRTVTEETSTAAAGAGEPGVIPNAGASLVTAPVPAANLSTRTEEEAKNQVLASVKKMDTRTPAGRPTITGVAVSVPFSDFARIWKSRNPDAKDPETKILQPLIDAQLNKVKPLIVNALGLKDPGLVSIDWYEDVLVSLDGPQVVQAATASAGAGVMALATTYTREIAIGALALVSLFMMMSMVKKGSVAPPMPVMEAVSEPVTLEAREPIAGEATIGGQMLDGMELDEDAVRTQQMLDQVQTMVREDPDAAANLVKRWLNRA